MTPSPTAASPSLQPASLPGIFPSLPRWKPLPCKSKADQTPHDTTPRTFPRKKATPDSAALEAHSDFELIDFTLEGQTTAFDLLVKRYSGSVYALAYRMLRNADDAADIAQDVFLKAYEALGSFRKKSSFHTWLYRITSNSCINYLRRYSAQRHIELATYHAVKEAESLDNLYAMELQDVVNHAIEHLPEKQKATVLLRVCEGLSHREVSGILKCSVGTAKANYFHAIRNLRRSMKHYINANEGEEPLPAGMLKTGSAAIH